MFINYYINILFILYHFHIKKRMGGKNWQLTHLLFYFILFIYIIPFLYQKKDGRKEHVFNLTIFFFFLHIMLTMLANNIHWDTQLTDFPEGFFIGFFGKIKRSELSVRANFYFPKNLALPEGKSPIRVS